ncbi:hypothetical protein quinque_013985 [Culex quinquefasciatus]
MPSVGLVSAWYVKSFEEVLAFEKTEPSGDNLEKFCQSLIKIRERHSDVVQTMAQGILELKESRNGHIEPSTELSMHTLFSLEKYHNLEGMLDALTLSVTHTW